MIWITLNGQPHQVAATSTAADAAASLGVREQERGVALALDGAVLTRADWERTPLHEGAVIELVRAAQGG